MCGKLDEMVIADALQANLETLALFGLMVGLTLVLHRRRRLRTRLAHRGINPSVNPGDDGPSGGPAADGAGPSSGGSGSPTEHHGGDTPSADSGSNLRESGADGRDTASPAGGEATAGAVVDIPDAQEHSEGAQFPGQGTFCPDPVEAGRLSSGAGGFLSCGLQYNNGRPEACEHAGAQNAGVDSLVGA